MKLFRKITDPTSWFYMNYACYNYFDERWADAARNYFKKFKGAALRKTYFPGVLRLITTKEEINRYRVPLFYRIKEENDFDQIEQAFLALKEQGNVGILDGNYDAGRKFKKRVNLALMDLSLQGKTVLAPVDSFFGEMPAITSFSNGNRPKFSSHFKRKKYAKYQDFLVKNYLLDPLIVNKLKKIDCAFEGRAYPDITLQNPREFLECILEINRKREVLKKPPLGFLNPILYNNAKIFLRNIQEEQHGFPYSVTLWRPNVGLGEPKKERFESLF